MKSFSSLALAASTLFIAVSNAVDDNQPSQGCFSSTLGLTKAYDVTTWNSKGSCGTDTCSVAGSPVFAMGNTRFSCYCGSQLPPASSKVDDKNCNQPCPGFPSNVCGANATYISVYLTADSLAGTISNINDDGSAASTTTSSKAVPSATTSSQPSVVTIQGVTKTIIASSSATATGSSSSSSGPSKAGIAAGVVVGLIAIAAIAGGVFLFIRNKRRREVEEEYRRNAAVNDFMNGSKHPTSSGGASSLSDMRLDPAVMAQRRMSDGSIADNQDYSRRILKVTNA